MEACSIKRFSWLGEEEKHLDKPSVTKDGPVVVGCYGGNTHAGQFKNEDAAMVWCGHSWEFAIVMDAHNSSESTKILTQLFSDIENDIATTLNNQSLWDLNALLIRFLNDKETRRKFVGIRGETACLIAARKDDYLYWFSIGDCVAYVLAPELAKMGQTALNQRQFYEWIGQVNTFDLPTQAYSSGVRQLRKGNNRILLVTDGLLEYPNSKFPDSGYFNSHFQTGALEDVIDAALLKVDEAKGRDSATIVGWDYSCRSEGLMPTG